MTTIVETITLRGTAAILTAERLGRTLSKNADPTEGDRDGLTVAEAREVASSDPELIRLQLDISLSEDAYVSVRETGEAIADDVRGLAMGHTDEESLLEHCLDGADPDRISGWHDYVRALVVATGI